MIPPSFNRLSIFAIDCNRVSRDTQPKTSSIIIKSNKLVKYLSLLISLFAIVPCMRFILLEKSFFPCFTAEFDASTPYALIL